MTLLEQMEAERCHLAKTFESVGPTAPTLCGNWTAFDLAAHVVSLERNAGVATFVGRSLVARGVRLNDRVGGLAERIIRRERRQGFEAIVERLTQPSPRLLRRRGLLAVGLFEAWMHHEDVAVPNGVTHDERPGLDHVLTWLIRYQSGAKQAMSLRVVSTSGQEWGIGSPDDSAPVVRGSLADLVRWCAGRPVRSPLEISGDEHLVAGLDAFHPHV